MGTVQHTVHVFVRIIILFLSQLFVTNYLSFEWKRKENKLNENILTK